MTASPTLTCASNFVYTVNRDFMNFALVSMTSVIRSQKSPCQFHVVHDGDLSESSIAAATKFIVGQGGTIDFYTIPESFPRQYSEHSTWDVSVLYRLALGHILPSDLKRVVYLDSDTLARGPLDELFSVDLGDQGLGAIPEDADSKERLGLPPDACYLNSGVLAIDLEAWRRNDASSKMLDMIMQDPDRWHFPDQDILAVHFANNWTRIAPEYNLTHRFFYGDSPLTLPTDDPALIHFSGQNIKPWQTHLPHPFVEEFWSTAQIVSDAGFVLPERPVKRYRWYQRGPIAAYKERRIRRRKIRRESGRVAQEAASRAFCESQQDLSNEFSPELSVKRGPFAGLRYPQEYLQGCLLSPKLLGTYEAELEPIVGRLLQKDYPLIIDIGGAEGYYAVGTAMRWQDAQVRVFELQRELRTAIRNMAKINGVADRVSVNAECMFGDLYGQRALIICDIEGCEQDLLINDHAEKGFANADFLIETHDMFRPGVTKQLQDRFSKTHTVTLIDSVSDPERPSHWPLPELSGASQEQQVAAMAEYRAAPMQWLICESKDPFPTRQVSVQSSSQAA